MNCVYVWRGDRWRKHEFANPPTFHPATLVGIPLWKWECTVCDQWLFNLTKDEPETWLDAQTLQEWAFDAMLRQATGQRQLVAKRKRKRPLTPPAGVA